MLGRFKTAWQLLGVATKAKKAWKRGGGGAVAGGAMVLVTDPKPVGDVLYGLLAHFLPDLAARIPEESAVTVLGILGGMLIGWLIGVLKEEATDKVEQASAKKKAQAQGL